MRRLGCAVFGVVLCVGWVQAQDSEPLYGTYRNAVVSYQRGNFAAAARTLNSWSIEELHRVVRFALGQARGGAAAGPAGTPAGFASEHIGGASPEAAAMLHTEIVLRGQSTSKAPVSVQLELAELLIRGMDRVRPRTLLIDREEALGFQQRWYVLVATYFLAGSNPEAATPWLERGAALSRADSKLKGAVAWLDVTKGVATEMAIHILDPECRRAGCESRGPRSPVPGLRASAEASYRRALSLDPGLAEARLRLAGVKMLQNDRKTARVELQRALVDATTTRQRYLAHLFLGEIEQVERDLVAARNEYEAARVAGPGYQTPYVALGFVAQLLGERDGLHNLAAAAARSEDRERDPWWGYRNGALDEEALAWLRAQVTR
jgi:tetratricopeptide (TPR) repeat protein